MLENYPINNKIQMAGGDMNRNSGLFNCPVVCWIFAIVGWW